MPSWKTRNDLSPFGDRLRKLMKGKSIRQIARDFHEAKLIVVNPRKPEWDHVDEKEKSAIGSIEKRIREHINADGPECLQGEYVIAYCTYFNCSTDYLFLRTNVKSSDMQIREIKKKTGLSEQVVTQLCELLVEQGGETNVHRCWSKLMEGDTFFGIPFDLSTAHNEACEVLKCDAAVEAIETVLKYEDPKTVEYNLIDIKKKPIQKTKDGHYAAYYGMLYKLAQNVTGILDGLIEEQISEEHYYEQALEDLTCQYRNEYYVRKGEPEKVERPKDGEFRFNKHFMI